MLIVEDAIVDAMHRTVRAAIPYEMQPAKHLVQPHDNIRRVASLRAGRESARRLRGQPTFARKTQRTGFSQENAVG